VKLALVVALWMGGCSDVERQFQVVPALSGCVPANVNSVQLLGLGDFPPSPARSTATTAMGTASLSLPAGTRVLEVDGLGPTGLVAFGRTPPFQLSALGDRVALNYGAPDSLCATGDMNYARGGHQATLLPSGSVLLSGGHDGDGFAVPKLELYVPFGDDQTPPGHFRIVDPKGPTALDPQAVLGHAVAVLPGGDFLITGGAGASAGKPTGIAYQGVSHYRADGVRFDAPGVLFGGGRAYHTATVLADGRVLLIGGCARFDVTGCAADSLLADSVIYNQGQWSAGPPLAHARQGHQALPRGDGKIWIVGGGPLELFDPATGGTDMGDLPGVAALLPTGALLAVDQSDVLLRLEAESVPLMPLPSVRSGDTLTLLEDGATLVAGGDTTLVLYDPVLGPETLGGSFLRREHSATRLGDGAVLLAGGAETGGASTRASIFLRNPLGPFANLPTLTFAGAGAPLVPRRPDRLRFTGGQMELTAVSPLADSRPAEFALIGALELGDLQLAVSLGLESGGGAAVLLSWQSDAHHAWISLVRGQKVTLSTMRNGSVQVVCSGEMFPDDSTLRVTTSWRRGQLQVNIADRLFLQCGPGDSLSRGAVGVGAISGRVTFDDLALTR
jgi:hypothetical protein